MIIFTTNANIITQDFLAYKGYDLNEINIYGLNLTSYENIFPSFSALLPPDELNNLDVNDPGYEYAYIHYIFNNPMAFSQFMYIMNVAYNDKIVLIHIDNRSQYCTAINENLARVISTRYGYPAIFCNTTEDLYSITIDPTFSVIGIVQITGDMKLLSLKDYADLTPDAVEKIMGSD